MRKSREETARTRERIVDAASEEIRANGVAGSGLAGVMKAAGLTHGGFYKHFGSKDQLVTESVARAFEQILGELQSSIKGKRPMMRWRPSYASIFPPASGTRLRNPVLSRPLEQNFEERQERLRLFEVAWKD